MGFHGMKKTPWILISLLPLALIARVDGRNKKKTTLSPLNATQEKTSNDTQDYRFDYYEYPAGLSLYNDTYEQGANNETYNDTYILSPYFNLYYGNYYGMYAYPELHAYYDETVDNSTNNMTPALMTTNKHNKGTRKPKVKMSRRKTRSIPEDSNLKHLCILNLLKEASSPEKYIRHILECEDNESKHFACLSSKGVIKSCYSLKDEKKHEMSLCVKKENAYVTTCNAPEPQSFCFTDPKETDKILICNDQKRRVCFSGGLTICNNQEKKRVPREIVDPRKDKPEIVNCNNCEVEVKMLVDEADGDSPPHIQVEVVQLDPSEMIDVVDADFDK